MLQYGEAKYRVWDPEKKCMRFIANSETIMKAYDRDKRGNIIFDGDIVRVFDKESGEVKGIAVVVKYVQGWHCEYCGHPYGHFFLNTLTAPLVEVIGNICEDGRPTPNSYKEWPSVQSFAGSTVFCTRCHSTDIRKNPQESGNEWGCNNCGLRSFSVSIYFGTKCEECAETG